MLPTTPTPPKPKQPNQPAQSGMTVKDIRDAWLRALVEFSEWFDQFAAQVVGGDAEIAMGLVFHQAIQQPGLADEWKAADPAGYARAAKAAGYKPSEV